MTATLAAPRPNVSRHLRVSRQTVDKITTNKDGENLLVLKNGRAIRLPSYVITRDGTPRPGSFVELVTITDPNSGAVSVYRVNAL